MKLGARGRALLGGIVWVAVGGMLVWRGFGFWFVQRPDAGLPWLALAIGLVLGAGKGVFVLRKSAGRMIRRIRQHPEPTWFWQMYPPYLYLLIPAMIALGLLLKAWLPDHPAIVLAVYAGIGAALISSSLPFFAAAQGHGATAESDVTPS